MSLLSNELHYVLSQEPDILFAYLFGSKVADNTEKSRDTDIALYLKSRPNAARKRELMEKIQRKVSGPIDLVILNHVGVTLAFEIVKEGQAFLCNDNDSQSKFETRTLSICKDRAPIRRRHREHLEKKYAV